MTTQIRQNVFETNSSSTHSICIAKDVELFPSRFLRFTFGDFGWENVVLGSIDEKASYLYTGLIDNDRQEDFKRIVATLERKGIEVLVVEDGEGYVDHAGELNVFLNDICSNEDKLMRFLFSPLSFIITGNDNDDSSVAINVDYTYDGYYKGN
jgi:hypothetical protein